MGIDRPDEDDTTVVSPDSPAVEGKPCAVENDASADSDEARAVYSDKPRADVEARYEAAWTEAVPELRESWTELTRRYPYPEQSRATVDSDGSWYGGNNRDLDPEQNAEVDRGCQRIREVGKEVILPGMFGVEADDSDRHLIGLEHYLKEPDRIKEKVADELQPFSRLTAAKALFEAVPDAVRFTFCYQESGYADGVRADTERLKARGFELIQLKNTWTNDQYKGINSQWRDRESQVRFEVQFHTQVSFEAKQLTHDAYERLRNPASTSKVERRELRGFQRQVCAYIHTPPGAPEIENYPPEKRDA